MKQIKTLLLFLCLSSPLFAQQKMATGKPVNLLTDNLNYWYKWIGVPHKSVTGLPAGTPAGDGMNGVPLGLHDPKNVFTVVRLNGEKVLRASGEIYGGLTTNKEYENYHFHLKYKWGGKKWSPREKLPRDMGIMFHLTGTNEDAFWSVFMMGLEFQISEKTSGDLFLVPNKTFQVFPFADVSVGKGSSWDVNAPLKTIGGLSSLHTLTRSENYESDSTKWTDMDLYTIGRSAIYLVNGHVVMAFKNAGLQKADGSTTPLTKGKIQLQSEGAEGFYKDITIQQISDYPEEIKKAAGFDLAHVWKLGVALWTFHTESLPGQLAKADSSGIHYIEGFGFSSAGPELKDSLLMQLSTNGLRKVRQIIGSHKNLQMESIYIVGGKTISAWKHDFQMAKILGVKFVTAEPPTDMWNVVDSLAGVYKLKVAIHNHWKGVSKYWSPDSVLAAIKGHPNFGVCADLGHYPKSGIDPVAALKKLEGHLISIHLKDISAYNNPKLEDVVAGTGVVNFPKVFAELKRQKFEGNIYIERDAQVKPDNLPSVIQIIKYYDAQVGLPYIQPAADTTSKNHSYRKNMLRHTVQFTFKDTVSDDQMNTFFSFMPALSKIPGVKEFKVNKQISDKNNFDYEISIGFENEDAFKQYLTNANHLLFIQSQWQPKIERFLEADFVDM